MFVSQNVVCSEYNGSKEDWICGKWFQCSDKLGKMEPLGRMVGEHDTSNAFKVVLMLPAL